jgi:hypothetical protein
VRDEIRGLRDELRGETHDTRAELKSDTSDLRTEMNSRAAKLESTFDRKFNLLFGALATGFVAAVVQHFIG